MIYAQAVVMATVMREFSIPLIASQATAPELSDKTLYPTFSRVVASDNAQGERCVPLFASLAVQCGGCLRRA